MSDALEIGYSYVRFSHPDQAKGDSLRRQLKGTAAWCEKNGVLLDTSLTLRDAGVSAFRGKNRLSDKAKLAAFLKLAEHGRIPKGSYLIIENLDRLSREEERPALRLWMDILDMGINIVQLVPETIFRHEKSEMIDIIRAIIELSRGHSESSLKSHRLANAWSEKQDDARASRSVQTTRLPGWIEVVGRKKVGKHMRGGEMRIIPERASIVQRIFDMACRGHGLSLIVKRLSEEKVPCWGRSGKWSKAYIYKILTGGEKGRAAMGEYQPIKGGKPNGDPIEGYYPAVVDEPVWNQAQAAIAGRKQQPGRVGHMVASLWRGLLWDARTRQKIVVANQTYGPKGKRYQKRVLRPAGSMEGSTPSITFPAEVFEDRLLKRLREIPAADVLGEEPEGKSTKLATELGILRNELAQIEEALEEDDGDYPFLIRTGKKLSKRETELARQLAEAQAREANPRAAAWSETQTLASVAKTEEQRLQLRSLLQRNIESIWLLIVPRRSNRMVAVQVHFIGGARRDYLLHYAAAGYCREMRCEVLSATWAADEKGAGRSFDLRRQKDMKAVEAFLLRLPL